MPNICCFDVQARGRKSDLLKLADWLMAQYDYHEGSNPQVYVQEGSTEREVEHHIGFRVFHFDYDESINNEPEDDAILNGYGDCAWSVSSCMFEDGYYRMFNDESKKSITIDKALKELNLDSIEIFSCENGMCFAEHYLITKEKGIEISEDADFYEINIENYETFEDLAKDVDVDEIPYTKDQFERAKEFGECYDIVCDFVCDTQFDGFLWNWVG